MSRQNSLKPLSEQDVISICKELFGGQAVIDNPFSTTDATVLRHRQSRKWFGLLMDVPLKKLEGGDDGRKGQKSGEKAQNSPTASILNLKADPLLERDGRVILPAYHMSKKHWISVVLERAERDQLEYLLCQSFELTKAKSKRPER